MVKMDEKLLFCVSINSPKRRLYGPEWKELDGGKTLIDLFLQVCGTDILGQQVQVLVSKERAFLEAAVVQVYTPLTVLAEKSQSYIQFILTTDNTKLEEHFGNKKSSSSYESSLGRHETFSIKSSTGYLGNDNKINTSYVSSVGGGTKPSFADMTVEEICDEIRRIRTKELSKSTIDSLDDSKYNDSIDKTKCDSVTPPIIKRPSSGAQRTPVKTPPSLKASIAPSPTKTSKLRTASNAKMGRNYESTPQTPPKRTPSPGPKRSPSPSLKRSPSPNLKRSPSPSLKRSPSPVPRKSSAKTTSETTLTSSTTTTTRKSSLKSLSVSPTTSTKKATDKQRSPDLDRLSALAKPRRRNSEPAKTTPVKKSCNPIRKASMKCKSPRLSNVKSRFVRPDSAKSDSSKPKDYFVEFFTQTADVIPQNTKDKSVQNTSKVDGKDLPNNEYGVDSLSACQIEPSNEVLMVSDVLAEIRDSQSPTKESTQKEEENLNSNENIIEMKTSDKLTTESDIMEIKFNDPVDVQEVTPTSDTTEIKPKNEFITMNIDSKLASPKKLLSSPQHNKSPLFSPLLEKIKQSNSSASSLEKSTSKKYFVFPPDGENNKIDVTRCSSGQTINIQSNDSSLNLSEDIPIDSLSISTSSKNNDLSSDHDTSKDTSEEKTWANSRGIKFKGSNKDTKKLNNTFTIQGGLSESNATDEKKSKSSEMSSEVIDESLECVPMETNPNMPHERKHWTNSLKGMDDLVVASLKAFSIELRSSSESVASNIKVLYERWRSLHEGADDEDGKEMTPNNVSSGALSKITPRASPPNEDVGIQQNIAFIFRNLRKIEVKLKTMEQATLTMVQSSTTTSQLNTKEQTLLVPDGNRRPSIHRSSTFH
eukprot:TCONS_00054188-protein